MAVQRNLPPGLLAQALVLTNPEFVMAGSAATQASLLALITNKQSYSALVQWLQQNSSQAQTIAAALLPGTTPSTAAIPLPADLVTALTATWADLEAAAFASTAFENLCWTVEQALLPSRETPSPATGSWTLAPFQPASKASFPSISYEAGGAFTVQVCNDAPRHLVAYATFLQNSTPVEPASWISLLPANVSPSYETATTKYLGILNPNTPVSAFAVSTTAQTLAFPLPANAGSVSLVFGGLAAAGFDPLQSIAGIFLTYVLDFAVPWIASRFPACSGTAEWYQSLLANAAIQQAILNAGAALINTATSAAAVMDNLAASFTSIFLSDSLRTLRDSIDTQFGSADTSPTPSQSYAATLGWSAQIVAAMIRRTPPAQFWISQASAAPLLLSPSTSVDLEVLVTPDPRHGTWPYALDSYTVTIRYGDSSGSFTQTQTGSVTAATAGASLPVSFGSVRNAGVFFVTTTLADSGGAQLATGAGQLIDHTSPPANRVRSVTVAQTEPPVAITGNTQFTLSRRLSYNGSAYVWDTSPASQPTPSTGITAVGITIQTPAQCIGYVWNASGQSLSNCSGTGPVTQPYLMQNIGAIAPQAELKTINCGLIQQPYLAYGADGYFLDPRTTPPCLRAVNLSAGSFDLNQTGAAGCFREAGISSVAIHPGGYAAGVDSVNSRLEIVRLAPSAVPAGNAPQSQVFGGPGQRPGLLLNPVAVAVTPSGFVLVLEQGNMRIQAFDIHGNPAALFAGSSVVALSLPAGAQPLDLAVSPAGFIYVLWSDTGGIAHLDAMSSSAVLLSRTGGLNAAKIAVDSRESVFSLDNLTIVGQRGQPEPSISVWVPALQS